MEFMAGEKSLLASVLQICLQITCVVWCGVCVRVELDGNSWQWEECWFYSCVSAITRCPCPKSNQDKYW